MSLSYSINDLERLTGIKAHTIRIWEKRYGLLSPARSDTNIRSYDDESLRKILNVNTLLKEGWKISHIGAMDSQELESQVWNTAKTGKTTEHVYEIYMQAMISATLAFDEEWFDTVYTDVTSRYGISLAMQNVIGPFLERIGLMWTVLRMHPGQEHFASNLVRRKLLGAIDRLPRGGAKGKYLLFLPPWEEHELGLIYAWYLLKSTGHDVVYLGQRVPLDAVRQSLEAVGPQSILTFLVTEESKESIQNFITSVRTDFQRIDFYLAARSEMLSEVELPSGIKILGSPQALMDVL